MKFDINEVKSSLEEYKGVFLEKLKESETATAEKINSIGAELDTKIENQLKEWKKRKLSLPGLEEETKKQKFHISKCLRAQLEPKGWDSVPDCGFEKEVLEEMAKTRSNNAQTGEAGGLLIPDEVTSEIIDLAMASTPVFEMGPTVMRGLRGELPIPKVTGRPQMFWVGEEEAPTETQTNFGEIVLRPKTAGAFTKISRRLLWQTAGTAEGVIRSELVKAFRLGLDTALLSGSGTEKVPKGILSFANLTATDNINLADGDGGRFRIDKASEMAMNIDVVNMLRGNLGYIMRPEVLSLMLRERSTQYSAQANGEGMPIFPNAVIMSQAQLEETLGYKVRTTTLLGTRDGNPTTANKLSDVIFGDWSQLVVGMWEGFEIKASDVAGNASGSALTQRQVWITAFQGIDSNIKDESGFTKVTDALTNP